MVDNNKKNCLIVKDTSTVQRKYLYNLLVENGYDKKYFDTIHLSGEDCDLRRSKPALYLKLVIKIAKLLTT